MSTAKHRKVGRPRLPAIEHICSNTYLGTNELVEALVAESTNSMKAWRPVRAATVAALSVERSRGTRTWMTQAEFGAWAQQHFPTGRKTAGLTMEVAVGITKKRRKSILEGSEVTPTEALAMAHFSTLGWARPIMPGNAEVFSAWYTPKFGAALPAAMVLEIKDATISDRLRGYALKRGARHERLPEIGLIRALDWLYRVGPFCPYGERPPGAAFPGQEVE